MKYILPFVLSALLCLHFTSLQSQSFAKKPTAKQIADSTNELRRLMGESMWQARLMESLTEDNKFLSEEIGFLVLTSHRLSDENKRDSLLLVEAQIEILDKVISRINQKYVAAAKELKLLDIRQHQVALFLNAYKKK